MTNTDTYKITTKLKCKPCYLFFKDDGSIADCPRCKKPLKQIKVHHVKVTNITVVPHTTKIGG